MAKITVVCDRCGKTIEGLHYSAENGLPGSTAGYYDTTGKPWSDFANEGERVVCDACMWVDARYQAVYGDMAANSLPPE